ncbi:MAG: hypothetical protein V4608_14765 [Bacteroidota bacterium]
MPTIITPADFTAELTIAQTENPYQHNVVQDFIDKYEPKFLRSLLGLELANDFVTGLTEDPIQTKWDNLRDNTDLKDMMKNYIYYWYKRNENTKSMGISEVKPKAENANAVDGNNKMTRAWNEMVKMNREFDLDVSVYPNWIAPNWFNNYFWHSRCGVNEIYYPISVLNL